MKKKNNRIAVRKVSEKAVIRDEMNNRILYAATNSIKDVLENLHTSMYGLLENAVENQRNLYGSNKVTHEKKKSVAKRLYGAFVNPFTAILFCLTIVSVLT